MRLKKIFFPMTMLAAALLLAAKAAHAEGTIEVMCRSKAKEIALQTYQDCVTEEKTARLKDLKDRYKTRMSEVKDEFQRELDDINGKPAGAEKSLGTDKPSNGEKPTKPAPKTSAKASAPRKAAKPGRAEKPVMGVAKALPPKANNNGPALPLNTVSEETAVIAATPSSGDDLTTPAPDIIDAPME